MEDIKVLDIVLEHSKNILETNFINEEQTNKIKDFGFQFVDEIKIATGYIPQLIKCPRYNVKAQINGLIEKMEKLTNSGVSKSIYKKFGVIEEEEDVRLVVIFIIEPKFTKFNQDELQEIIHNDDPDYKIL